MAITADSYARQLRQLLPPGQLWARLAGGDDWRNLLKALGASLMRAHKRIAAMPREADPRTASARLPDWETSVGLPDTCIPGGGSLQQRRNAVVARLRSTGGASPAYFIGLAAGYGYTITITPLGPAYWRATAAEDTVVVNCTCNGGCDDQLEAYGNDQLECLLNRVKPAHTQLDIAYGGP
ncbi:MAG TPA: putative phage tail protein [Nevskiaceae bacterium]|nr:putative phage tail protein [Nevskiaceae bacterium]